MKKNFFFLVLLYTILSSVCSAQTGIITTVAGNGTAGYGGDGGPAILAKLHDQTQICFDQYGNLYIADQMNHRIRKVNTEGMITTFAGYGGSGGYTGDGVQATATSLNRPMAVCADGLGNIYIADMDNARVRKVSPSGIISTFAGTGFGSFSGDGGPATAAAINHPGGVACDALNNIYISDCNSQRIRKVDAAGIITTYAGNGVTGFSGDGGPATLAALSTPAGLAIDASGNLLVADYMNNRIRKVTPSGIITTIAGNGSGFSGDGGPATAAGLSAPHQVSIDALGNIYVVDNDDFHVRKINTAGFISSIAGVSTAGYNGDFRPATTAQLNYAVGVAVYGDYVYIGDYINNRIRKVGLEPEFHSDSFNVYIQKLCSGPSFIILKPGFLPSSSVKTYFGDGSFNSVAMTDSAGNGFVSLTHSYGSSGTYSLKHVLLLGGVPIDSVSYNYEYKFCNDIPLKIFYDANSNCIKDSADFGYRYTTKIEVDSNSIPIDTISVYSGDYYRVYGAVGDIYRFKILSAIAGFPSCPPSGIVFDTVKPAGFGIHDKLIGFNCSSSSAFNLCGYNAMIAGRHLAMGSIQVNNYYCTPAVSSVTMTFSPKYTFEGANLAPASIIGNTVTWNTGTVSGASPLSPFIHYTLALPSGSSWLMPGDTANSKITITPTTGDIDSTNNIISRCDTIKSSFDPNEMDVSPEGNIPNNATLQYTIQFENTGNDTAKNIHILDTLSNFLDPTSLQIVTASSQMNISLFRYDTFKILKFDFPNINLPDSSHHYQCDGMIIYNIKTRPSLPCNIAISNRAGIYFDDNEVVMTNSAFNSFYCPPVDPQNINIITASRIEIFPSPTNDLLNIQMPDISYNSFSIINSIGQVMIQQRINSTQTKVNVQTFTPGVYYISFKGQNGIKCLKFLKM